MRAMKGSWSLPVLLLLSTIPAQAGEGTVLYRLANGGMLIDECLSCGRMPIEIPIEGTFLLTYLFLAGKEPPEPGPSACGQAPKPLLGCGSYGACGAGAAGR